MRSPTFLLTAFVLMILAATSAVFYGVLSGPYVSLPIAAGARPVVTLEDPAGGNRIMLGLLSATLQLPPGVTGKEGLSALLRDNPAAGVAFEPEDFVEDPDMLTSYAAINRFYERQTRIAAMIESRAVRGAVSDVPDGNGPVTALPLVVEEARPLSTLPLSFWFQIGSGLIVILIAAFLLAMRPRNVAVSALAFAGLGVTGSAYAAAIYSSRQFGMDDAGFRVLSTLNHICALGFGWGIIGLFSIYPVRLLHPAKLLAPIVLSCLAALASYRFQLLPHDLVMTQNLLALEMLAILALVAAQYLATRGRPADRAALLWLGMSVISGAAAFVLLVTLPVSLGYRGLVTQAVGFVLLCMVYIGTAFAVTRYRLFDIGRWSYRVFFYTGVIAALLALDMIFVLGLQMSAHTSLATASVVALVGYLPFRDLLYERLVRRSTSDLPDLYRKTVAVAYRLTAAEKQAAWIDVLESVFRPGHMENNDRQPSTGEIDILNEGIELAVPGYPWSTPLTLGLAEKGRRLFNRADIDFLEQLVVMVRSAEADRLGYEKGAREERHRIARDLHDEVGATLLTGLHSTSETRRHESIMDALADIRQISRDLAGQDLTMEQFVARLRHECRDRAEIHGITIEWPIGEADESGMTLPYRFHRSISAILREALSNALTHGEGPIRIGAGIDHGMLRLEISNPLAVDKAGAGEPPNRGQGSGNLRARARELGGAVELLESKGNFVVRLALPLPEGIAA